MLLRAKCAALVVASLFAGQSFAETYGVRGSILHFSSDPAQSIEVENSYEYIEDGLLVVRDGTVVDVKPYHPTQSKRYSRIEDYSGKLIMPRFIDTHVHYPQTQMIASYGKQLLEWLDTYTFPTERRFEDKAHATKVSKLFIHELVKNGTTTALVFGTVHPQSIDALFEETEKLNMRMIAGKVMMDRNAPSYLLDTADSSYEESKALIEKWHNKGRLQYAITPPFCPNVDA